MQVDIFSANEKNLEKFGELLNDSGRNVKKVIVVGHERTNDTIYCISEVREETLGTEKERLIETKAYAKEVEKDERYQELKSQRQRVLWLLDKYNLERAKAEDVIEWLNAMKAAEGK